jgi:hypothetical protein
MTIPCPVAVDHLVTSAGPYTAATIPSPNTQVFMHINTITNQPDAWWDPVAQVWHQLLETPDTFRIVQPLVAGNNVIIHNLGAVAVGAGFSTEVEVRDNATGATITARVVAETANSVTLFVPVAVAAARITIDV